MKSFAMPAALILSLLPWRALALTSPIEGGVSLPQDFDLKLPFEAGVTARAGSGYGPSGGSRLHSTTNAGNHANDYYALDFILPDFPDNGKGQPVLAAASGTVVLSGWADSGWENYGQRVYVEYDYNADGHGYVSIYAHLNALSVGNGDRVEQGDLIGELGGSCKRQLSCDSFSNPHLHFALYRDSTSEGSSGSGGYYAGHSVVPEPFDGYEDITRGMDMVSTNGGGGPRPPCAVIAPAGAILDDLGPCFRKAGSPAYWHEEAAGWEGHLLWTYATSDAAADNTGRWELYFEQAGRFTVDAYTAASFGMSGQAAYRVRHAGVEDVFAVDQSAADGWNRVAELDFSQGGDQWIRLDDNTGEAVSNHVKLVFDAVRISPQGVNPQPDAGGPIERDAGGPQLPDAGGPIERDAGGPQLPDASHPVDAAAPRQDAGGAGPGDNDSPPVQPDAGAPGQGMTAASGGCGCRAAAESASAASSLLFAFWLLLLIPRRRSLP